jgi:hypothetical protein
MSQDAKWTQLCAEYDAAEQATRAAFEKLHKDAPGIDTFEGLEAAH